MSAITTPKAPGTLPLIDSCRERSAGAKTREKSVKDGRQKLVTLLDSGEMQSQVQMTVNNARGCRYAGPTIARSRAINILPSG